MTPLPAAPPDPYRSDRRLRRIIDRAEGWAETRWRLALEFFEERTADFILRRLYEEIPGYELRVPNNMASLLRVIRLGDVVLIEGRRRLSFVIQKITSSPWSHATLYIGHGQILEAEEHGVVVSPIMKYAGHNIRLCTPRAVDEADRRRIVELAKVSLGRSYDVTNIRNLLVSYLAAQRDRGRFVGNLEECQEMCSGLLARAFEAVGDPVLPGRHYSQVLPRDFDLSPHFDIVKFNMLPETGALLPQSSEPGPRPSE